MTRNKILDQDVERVKLSLGSERIQGRSFSFEQSLGLFVRVFSIVSAIQSQGTRLFEKSIRFRTNDFYPDSDLSVSLVNMIADPSTCKSMERPQVHLPLFLTDLTRILRKQKAKEQ